MTDNYAQIYWEMTTWQGRTALLRKLNIRQGLFNTEWTDLPQPARDLIEKELKQQRNHDMT